MAAAPDHVHQRIYRLSAIDPKARKFLAEEMEKFFFGGGSAKPTGYQPEK